MKECEVRQLKHITNMETIKDDIDLKNKRKDTNNEHYRKRMKNKRQA